MASHYLLPLQYPICNCPLLPLFTCHSPIATCHSPLVTVHWSIGQLINWLTGKNGNTQKPSIDPLELLNQKCRDARLWNHWCLTTYCLLPSSSDVWNRRKTKEINKQTCYKNTFFWKQVCIHDTDGWTDSRTDRWMDGRTLSLKSLAMKIYISTVFSLQVL